jgi:predicted phage tail protein
MTNIYIKGKLAKIYGSHFKLKIKNVFDVFKALDCLREGFFKKYLDLHKNGENYELIVDGEYLKSEQEFMQRKKIHTIYIVPLVLGGGFFGVGAAIVGSFAGSAFAASFMGVVVSKIIDVAISSVISLAINMLTASLMKQATPPKPPIDSGASFSATGGTVGSVSGSRSYIFQNRGNVLAQGSPVTIGYGRLLIGTSTIMASMTNYPTNIRFEENFSSKTELVLN